MRHTDSHSSRTRRPHRSDTRPLALIYHPLPLHQFSISFSSRVRVSSISHSSTKFYPLGLGFPALSNKNKHMASWLRTSVRFLADDYFMSDEFFGTFVPILVYWAYSGMYTMMPASLDRYRLHPKRESELKNSVSKAQVVKGVLIQQTVQSAVAILLFALARGSGAAEAVDAPPTHSPSFPVTAFMVASQFLVAMVVVDTYQYFTHWYLHHNRFLYRHVHSIHHRVVVTHAFGALYGHPLWDGVIDTVGTVLGYFVSGMSPRTAVFFFSFGVIKVIDDHCGMWLPGNPFHLIFANNSAFHDFHHQLGGGKYNFSQPFFITWDKIMGTHMPVAVERRGVDQGQGYVIMTNKHK